MRIEQLSRLVSTTALTLLSVYPPGWDRDGTVAVLDVNDAWMMGTKTHQVPAILVLAPPSAAQIHQNVTEGSISIRLTRTST